MYIAFEIYEVALRYYDRALALHPGDARTLNNRANAYRQLGRSTEALRSFDEALARENHPEILTNRGFYALERGEYTRALADCEAASRLDYRNDRAYYGIGVACIHLAKYERALENLDKSIELNPKVADYFFQRARATFQLAQYEEARHDLEKARDLGADAEPVQALLQQCYDALDEQTVARSGGYDEELFDQTDILQQPAAKPFTEKGVPLIGNEREQIQYALELYQGKRFDRAIAAYSEVLEQNPEQFAAY